MALNEFIANCLDQHSAALVKSLDGLSPEELSWRPDRQCMSIGFVVWHLARAQDFIVQSVANGAPQLWEGQWASQFNRSPGDPQDMGFGFMADEMDAFKVPSVAVIRGYFDATHASALEHLRGLDDATLNGVKVASPLGGHLILAALYQQLIWELNQHGGQVAYLRGMQRGIEDPMDIGTVWGAARDAG